MASIANLIDLTGQADWLTRERVLAWGRVLFIVEVLLLGFLALWQHGVFGPVAQTPASDFASFYAAGKLALAGTPALAYDQGAHFLAQQQVSVSSAPHQFFFYPPVFLMLCAALAMMPYLVAFAVFELVTLGTFVLMMRALLREPGIAWLAPLLAFPAVFWNVGLGQNAFMTASLLGGFTLLMDQRPVTAGMLLGGLCYKPHLGLLVPIGLLAGRRWRAFAGALGSVAMLCAVSLMLFGWQTWSAYLSAFVHSDQVYTAGAIDFAGIVTPFGAARLLGVGAGAAYAVLGIGAAAMALLTAWLWHRDVSANLRAGALLSATLLAVPVALLYDKLLLLVAAGWLLREARQHGLLAWEKLVLFALYPLDLLAWPLATAYHLPCGPISAAAVLALCLRRAWHDLPSRQRAARYAGPLGATP
jgi:alpha-1,2-mannosyltransferase